MSDVELKRCPFCGSDKAAYKKDYDLSSPYIHVVICNCGARSPDAKNKETAIKNWNRRSPPAAADGWRMVPMELTPAMAAALESNFAKTLAPSDVHVANWKDAYAVMLSAAPEPPK